jgi:hypothetical protein
MNSPKIILRSPRNTDQCSHCGKIFVRTTTEIPLVNRSDGKSFHIELYSRPEQRSTRSTRFPSQVVCSFTYVNEATGLTEGSVAVAMPNANESPEELLSDVEKVADKLEELAVQGKELEQAYTFDAGQLLPGFPE